MGKSLPSSTKLQEFTKVVASEKFQRPNRRSPKVKAQLSSPSPESSKGFVGVGLETLRLKMESSERRNSQRSPLSEVVSDCVKRWFQDTLKEARAGDRAMQLLVGQMYYSGYGIPKDAHKGRTWISRASRSRSSVWEASHKQPGALSLYLSLSKTVSV